MSILDKMRSGTDSTLMQIVLGLVLISFVAWSGAPDGDKSGVIAKVNGRPILGTTYQRSLSIAERNREAGMQRALTESEQVGLREEVKQRLIEELVVRQEAERLGLEISDTEVLRDLLAVSAFQNEEGKFDRDVYLNTLRRMGYNESDYEEERRFALLREKTRQLVQLGGSVSEPALKDAFVQSNTRIDIEYVRVTPMRFIEDVDVSEAVLQTFVSENKEQIEAVYQADFDRLYNLPEKVSLRVIRLGLGEEGQGLAALQPRMDDLRRQLDGGADFSQLATRWSEDPSAAKGGDLGVVPVPQLDSVIADAVALLEPGQVSTVLADADQVRIVKLEERVPARVIPVEEVQADIAKKLVRDDQAPDLATAFAERLLAAWKDGAGVVPEAMLAEQGLSTAQTGPIGMVGDGSPYSPPAELLADAGKAAPGDVLPRVYENEKVYWVAKLSTRTEADLALFEDEKDTIREEVLVAKRAAVFDAWVTDAVSRADVE
jgi:peptidyl-prolyl cis-trans isomerase D